jgi:formate--tetrahydrofolate ligase
MMSLLTDAILPNLVQTTEGTPALVHAGPFGNIAHGTSSILAHKMGVRLADYVVNECGFAADLGAEKYIDIVMRTSGIPPAAAVLVTTVRSLRAQGQGHLEAGLANLDHHIRTLRAAGVPTVIAINWFPDDTTAELELIAGECNRQSISWARVEAFTKGGEGAVELAEKVVDLIEAQSNPVIHPHYSLEEPLEEKIRKVATRVYGAEDVAFGEKAIAKLARYAEWGFAGLPVCVAKTQYSLTDNPKVLGAPKGWKLQVNDVSLSAGAGFVVAIAGNMMLMPGLPSHPRAIDIDVDKDGNIDGV